MVTCAQVSKRKWTLVSSRFVSYSMREVGSSCTETQAYPVVCIMRSLWRIPEGTGYLYVQKGVRVRVNRLSLSAASLDLTN
jgi:hypothetical protein